MGKEIQCDLMLTIKLMVHALTVICPGKRDTENPLGFSVKNGLLDNS